MQGRGKEERRTSCDGGALCARLHSSMPLHDIVVIGASAGGVQALCKLTEHLPKDLAAAVMVVLHIGDSSNLPEILARCGRLPVSTAEDGQPIERGRIVVAPPTRHLVIRDGHLALTRAARENRHRPAIDPLFRSAARVYRERVVGIVLSGGNNDDGSAGLFTIKSRGGVTMVQDPDEAQAPWMPQNAMRETRIDHCLPLVKMARLLVKFAGRGKRGAIRLPQPQPRKNGREAKQNKEREVPFSCPECHGPMFEVREGKLVYFHCDVGHAYAPHALTEAHTEALERALWIAIRTLRERITIQQRLAVTEEMDGENSVVEKLRGTIDSAVRDVALLQEIIERL